MAASCLAVGCAGSSIPAPPAILRAMEVLLKMPPPMGKLFQWCQLKNTFGVDVHIYQLRTPPPPPPPPFAVDQWHAWWSPFRELEFMHMILLHIPAYKHLISLIGLRWQQSWRRTWGEMWLVTFNATNTKLLFLIATVRASWFFWSWMMLTYLSVPATIFLDLFLHPSCIGNLMSSIAKQTSQRVGSHFCSLRYLTPGTILYLYKAIICPCMEYCSHIWGGAPQSGCLDLLDRFQEAGQFNWPCIVINSAASYLTEF